MSLNGVFIKFLANFLKCSPLFYPIAKVERLFDLSYNFKYNGMPVDTSSRGAKIFGKAVEFYLSN